MSETQLPSAGEMLWMGLGGSPGDMVFWAAIGTAATAIIVTMIWSHTATYLEHFGREDHVLAVWGVIGGTIICTAHLIASCVQCYKLANHAHTDYASIAHFDNLSITLLAFVGSCFTLVGCAFYSWRVYKLWGKRWWFIPPLAVVIVTPFAWAFPLIKRSAEMPSITIESFTDGSFANWSKDMKMYWRVWQALTFSGCIIVGGLLLTVLNKPRTSLFSVERRVYRRLTSLVMETMLPPAAGLIILEACGGLPGSPYADWRRAVFAIISPLYFLSVLHSLVARLDIRRILNKELTDHGIGLSAGSSSGGKVFVSHQSDATRGQSPEPKDWNGDEEQQVVRY